MSYQVWVAFFVAGWVIALSPGSGAVLSMSHGLSYGVKNSTATILGLQAGLWLTLIVAGAGVGSLLIASELAFQIVKVIGASYLMYLGIKQWRSEPHTTELAHSEKQLPSWRSRFLIGFFTNATNPKGILFMVAVLPQFINGSQPLLGQMLVMGLTLTCIDLIVMHGYAFAASTLQRYFQNPSWVKAQNRFFGGLLIAIGAGLLFVKRQPS